MKMLHSKKPHGHAVFMSNYRRRSNGVTPFEIICSCGSDQVSWGRLKLKPGRKHPESRVEVIDLQRGSTAYQKTNSVRFSIRYLDCQRAC
jgi:hypothetical protein